MEHLFRVFDKELKMMSKISPLGNTVKFSEPMGSIFTSTYSYSWQFIRNRPERFEVMQYTNLTTIFDEPNKIFRLDVLKASFNGRKSELLLVDWDEDEGGYIFTQIDGDEWYTWYELRTLEALEKLEIIGNSMQNPELLEADNARI
jgi:hypothetical protein